MNTYKPDGWSRVTPRIFTDDVAGQARFLKNVFAAEGEPSPGSQYYFGIFRIVRLSLFALLRLS